MGNYTPPPGDVPAGSIDETELSTGVQGKLDDVLNFANLAAFPGTGAVSKLYRASGRKNGSQGSSGKSSWYTARYKRTTSRTARGTCSFR